MAVGIDYKDILNINNEQGTEYLVKLKTGPELVAAELNLLFSIDKYSLFFGNNIGLDLGRFLYTENKLATFNMIRYTIENFFSTYSKADLIKLEIQFSKAGKVVVDLVVNVDGTVTNISLNLPKDGTVES